MFIGLKLWSVIVNPPVVLALAMAPIGTSELPALPLMIKVQLLPLLVVVPFPITVGMPVALAMVSGHSLSEESITGSENAIMTVSRPLLSSSAFSRIETLSRVGKIPSAIFAVSAFAVP